MCEDFTWIFYLDNDECDSILAGYDEEEDFSEDELMLIYFISENQYDLVKHIHFYANLGFSLNWSIAKGIIEYINTF
tara:strand:+ start:490 stop:720 length:231 start_codon:yes stop_codon:yes gene_type:complete